MNNRQARLFAIAATGVAALVFIGLTVDSHRQFPALTNAENITPQVSHGMDVWRVLWPTGKFVGTLNLSDHLPNIFMIAHFAW